MLVDAPLLRLAGRRVPAALTSWLLLDTSPQTSYGHLTMTMKYSPDQPSYLTDRPAAESEDPDRYPTASEVPAGEFKAKCLGLIDEVAEAGAAYVITKRGKPMARLVPLAEQESPNLLGSILFEDDLISPIDEPWDAEQ